MNTIIFEIYRGRACSHTLITSAYLTFYLSIFCYVCVGSVCVVIFIFIFHSFINDEEETECGRDELGRVRINERSSRASHHSWSKIHLCLSYFSFLLFSIIYLILFYACRLFGFAFIFGVIKYNRQSFAISIVRVSFKLVS